MGVMYIYIALNVDQSNGEISESTNLDVETFFSVLHG